MPIKYRLGFAWQRSRIGRRDGPLFVLQEKREGEGFIDLHLGGDSIDDAEAVAERVLETHREATFYIVQNSARRIEAALVIDRRAVEAVAAAVDGKWMKAERLGRVLPFLVLQRFFTMFPELDTRKAWVFFRRVTHSLNAAD